MADLHVNQEAMQQMLDLIPEFVDETLVPAIANDMRRLAPVDTGELRDSIHERPGGRIDIEAPHAAHVEFGTDVMEAQPFIRPALYRKRGGG